MSNATQGATLRAAASWRTAAVVALIVAAACAVALGSIITILRVQLTKLPIEPESGLKFHTLPQEFAGWRMVRDEVISAEAQAELGTQNYVTRWYIAVDESGKAVQPETVIQLHCAYYTGMIDTVPHVPDRCFIGGGMEYSSDARIVPIPLDRSRLVPDPDYPPTAERGVILSARNERVSSRVRLPFGVENLAMKTRAYRDAKATTRIYAGYFFLANGGVVASADDVRLLAFKLHDDYAYYAKVQFMSPTASTPEELAALAGSVLDEIFPDIMLRVPDWIDVEEGLYPPDNPRRLRREAAAKNR